MSAFNANVQPEDTAGQSIKPGRYRVTRGGEAREGAVFEDETTGDLWITFDRVERSQRVDEISQFCTWERVQ